MKHQIRTVINTVTRTAEAELKEQEARHKEMNAEQDVPSDPLKRARELDYLEHRLLLLREYCRALHVLGDAITGDILNDPVPDRDNEGEY